MVETNLARLILHEKARNLAADCRNVADELDLFYASSPAGGFVLFIYPEGGLFMSSIQINDDHPPIIARVTFRDSEGVETPPDTLPVWESSDEGVATIAPSEDGLSATITIGTIGATVISVTTTETSTNTDIVAQGTITVVPGNTVVGEVSFDTGDTPTA